MLKYFGIIKLGDKHIDPALFSTVMKVLEKSWNLENLKIKNMFSRPVNVLVNDSYPLGFWKIHVFFLLMTLILTSQARTSIKIFFISLTPAFVSFQETSQCESRDVVVANEMYFICCAVPPP